MSASYGIINRHRGTITVDSVEGQGTTFSIKFPRPEKVIKEKKKPIANEQNGTSILVVEDEEGVRTILKDILEDGGYKVEVAPNGKKGIKLFQEKKFNLVFTDLGMPGMSGWQVAEEIKKINGKTKVALVTGWEVDLNNNELKKCGVDLVINKPFQMNQILGSVKEMMEDGAPIA
jgi:CheY-like chemotaxis protein